MIILWISDFHGAPCQRMDVEIPIYVDVQSLHTSLPSILRYIYAEKYDVRRDLSLFFFTGALYST